MLRITPTIDRDGNQLIRLEGRLSSSSVMELARQCGQTLQQGGAVTLEMSGVRFLERGGVSKMKALVQNGVVLTGCSPFIAAQLQRVSRRNLRNSLGGQGNE